MGERKMTGKMIIDKLIAVNSPPCTIASRKSDLHSWVNFCWNKTSRKTSAKPLQNGSFFLGALLAPVGRSGNCSRHWSGYGKPARHMARLSTNPFFIRHITKTKAFTINFRCGMKRPSSPQHHCDILGDPSVTAHCSVLQKVWGILKSYLGQIKLPQEQDGDKKAAVDALDLDHFRDSQTKLSRRSAFKAYCAVCPCRESEGSGFSRISIICRTRLSAASIISGPSSHMAARELVLRDTKIRIGKSTWWRNVSKPEKNCKVRILFDETSCPTGFTFDST